MKAVPNLYLYCLFHRGHCYNSSDLFANLRLVVRILLIGHYVPIGWNFPHGITLKALWDLWFFGNEAANIRPYRSISKEHDIKVADKMHYCRAFKTIEFTESLIRQYTVETHNLTLSSLKTISALIV